MDLTKIEKPIALLDEPTKTALFQHGGPYQVVGPFGGWTDTPKTKSSEFNYWMTYRVKPAPVEIKAYAVVRDGLVLNVRKTMSWAITEAKAIYPECYIVELTGFDRSGESR